jgi:hypothetical protein
MVNLKGFQLHEAKCIWKEEESLERKVVDNWEPSRLQQTYANFTYYKHQGENMPSGENIHQPSYFGHCNIISLWLVKTKLHILWSKYAAYNWRWHDDKEIKTIDLTTLRAWSLEDNVGFGNLPP